MKHKRGWLRIGALGVGMAGVLLASGCGRTSLEPTEQSGKPEPRDAAPFEAAAARGDASAQNDLGKLYLRGEGVRRDLKKAVELFRASADQGLAEAEYHLAMLHEAGRGVPLDLEAAAGYYRRAAEKGLAKAQYCLASAYAYGRGVARNDGESLRWLREAAQGGDGLAQYALGLRFQNGVGVPVDRSEAWKWLELSRAQRTEGAAEELKTIEPLMAPSERSEARERVKRFRVRPPPTPATVPSKPGPVVGGRQP